MTSKEKYLSKTSLPHITTPLTRFMKTVIEVLDNNLMLDELQEEYLYKTLYEEMCKYNKEWLKNE